jgi:hypothetical protein
VIQLLKKHFPESTVDTQPLSRIIEEQVKQFIQRVRASLDKSASRMDLEEMMQRVDRLLSAYGLQTSYAGRYPHNFQTQVIDQLAQATRSVQIACDYPAYGFLTNQELYKNYKKVLLDRAGVLLGSISAATKEEQAKVFSLTISAAATRNEIIKYPVPESSEGWEKFMNTPSYRPGREALRELLRRRSVGPNAISNPSTLYEAIAIVNELELKEFPFPYFEVAERMPIFAWIRDRSYAAFAIPTYLESDESVEHAFSTNDPQLIRALESIIEGYRQKAVSSRTGASQGSDSPGASPGDKSQT